MAKFQRRSLLLGLVNRKIFREEASSSERIRTYPFSTFRIAFLFGLLILPAIALAKLGPILDGWYVLGGFVAISLITYLTLYSDKRKAQAGQWRISEATLHLMELLGGWPASYFAQRRFRHKISKGSYQFVYWMIVLAYQLVALEFLNSWKYSQQLIAYCLSLQ